MLFNSFEFAVFFAIVYGLYLLLKHRAQNLLLLAASYVFYGWWDWRYLGLIWAATAIDYVAGLRLAAAASPGSRKAWLWSSIATHLAMLGFFKYYNFFIDSFDHLLAPLGYTAAGLHLTIVLPVGISFFTFQTMGYTIDVYRGQFKPTRNLIDFALFAAFFPQLLSGPIGRAKQLLPTIAAPRIVTMTDFYAGVHLILWGLFTKVVVADNLAEIVKGVYAPESTAGCFSAMLAAVAFTFQIFCDFSGYTDIARGCARCLGIDLMLNFNLPYFASDLSDFWHRWHISLSTWLRDYVYISLGGNRGGERRTYVNLFVTMLLGGLWHGASWTFVLWGAYHGALLVAHRAIRGRAPSATWQNATGAAGRVRWAANVAVTFALVCIGWVIFRANDWNGLMMIARKFVKPEALRTDVIAGEMTLVYILPVVAMQAWQYFSGDLDRLLHSHWAVRGAAYACLIWGLIIFGNASGQAFIYFQF